MTWLDERDFACVREIYLKSADTPQEYLRSLLTPPITEITPVDNPFCQE